MSHDIMIDLETLGTIADAVILSIGAVAFDLESGDVYSDLDNADYTFYRTVHIKKQVNRQICADTLQWWMTQSNEAQSVFFSTESVFLFTALGDLRDWVRRVYKGNPTVWSNGADFDLPMLNHAYEAANISPPWAPYAGRCYRTYKNLPGARAIKVERQGCHHNALDDAIYQAQHLCAIYAALFGSKQEGGAA